MWLVKRFIRTSIASIGEPVLAGIGVARLVPLSKLMPLDFRDLSVSLLSKTVYDDFKCKIS